MNDACFSLAVDSHGFITSATAKPAGFYRVTDMTSFQTVKRPNWMHRAMARLLLGWKWIPSPSRVGSE